MPWLVYIDADETLIHTTFKGEKDRLCKAAQDTLGRDSVGLVAPPADLAIFLFDGKPISAERVEAIARREMIEMIFRPYFRMLHEAKLNKVNSPIKLFVLTSGLYDPIKLRRILYQFYREAYPQFALSPDEFPIEIITKHSFPSLPTVRGAKHAAMYQAKDFRETKGRLAVVVYDDKAPCYDPRKALVMVQHQEESKAKGEEIPTENIYLFDDSYVNLCPARDAGFNTIPFHSRADQQSTGDFTDSFNQASVKFAKIMGQARKELKQNILSRDVKSSLATVTAMLARAESAAATVPVPPPATRPMPPAPPRPSTPHPAASNTHMRSVSGYGTMHSIVPAPQEAESESNCKCRCLVM